MPTHSSKVKGKDDHQVEKRVFHSKEDNTLMKFYMDKTRKSPSRKQRSPEKTRDEANEDLALLNAEVAISLHYSPLKRPESIIEMLAEPILDKEKSALPKTIMDKKPSSCYERRMEVRR